MGHCLQLRQTTPRILRPAPYEPPKYKLQQNRKCPLRQPRLRSLRTERMRLARGGRQPVAKAKT